MREFHQRALLIVLAASATIGAAVLVWKIDPQPITLERVPAEQFYTVSPDDPKIAPELRIASVETLQNVSSIMVTLGVGLIAAVGFSVGQSLGRSKAVNIITATSTYVFLALQILAFKYAYDMHAAAAVQLDSGYILLSTLTDTVEKQALSLSASAAFAAWIFASWIVSKSVVKDMERDRE